LETKHFTEVSEDMRHYRKGTEVSGKQSLQMLKSWSNIKTRRTNIQKPHPRVEFL
jgi:hypothetical protein